MRPLRFRLAGIPITIDPSFWIIAVLFGLSRIEVGAASVALWVAIMFLGVLTHELGHASAFRAFGRSPRITLYAMGGLTSAPAGMGPWRRFVTSLAGPVVGLVIGFGALALRDAGVELPGGLVGRIALRDVIWVNLGWSLLNLAPLYPLDGGQTLESLLQGLRVPKAELITSVVSLLVVAVGGWWLLQRGAVFAIFIVIMLGMLNLRRLTSLQARGRQPTGAPGPGGVAMSAELARTMAHVDQALRQDRPDDAVEISRQELQLRPSPQAARLHAVLLARLRRMDEAEALLADHGRDLDPATLGALAAALVAGGRYEAGLRAAETAWRADPQQDWRHAVTAAAARSGLGDRAGAIRWLHVAIDAGWRDRDRLNADPAFADVRADPSFGTLLARMDASV